MTAANDIGEPLLSYLLAMALTEVKRLSSYVEHAEAEVEIEWKP